MSNNIDAVGRAGSKDYFLAKTGIEKALYLFACLFVGVGCFLRKRMYSSVDIGVLKAVVMNQCIDNRLWLLTCSRVVKINQRLIVDLPEQNRKISSYFFNIKAHNGYKSNPICTFILSAISLLIRFLSSGISTLSNTLLAKAYINKALASFSAIPRARM